MHPLVCELDLDRRRGIRNGWVRIVRVASLAALFYMPGSVMAVTAAELQRETIEAFEQHVAASEQGLDEHISEARPLLSSLESHDRISRLRQGEIVVGPKTGKGDISVPKGIIHHWSGAVFVPGRSIADALALLQNYDAHKRVYPASVEDSKTLEQRGNHYRAYLRLRSHRFVTVVLNTEHEAEFVRVDAKRWFSRSHSTRIAQVEDAGGPNESELPVGNDSGFLWRIVTLWRFQEADGGVYLECEVIGLTRSVPYGLGWLIRPIIRSFPRESLTQTLSDTRRALVGNSGLAPTGIVSFARVNNETAAAKQRTLR